MLPGSGLYARKGKVGNDLRFFRASGFVPEILNPSISEAAQPRRSAGSG